MFKIVTNDKAKSLRKKFICKFVNTETECYTQIRNIDTEAVVENQTYFYLRDTLTYEKNSSPGIHAAFDQNCSSTFGYIRNSKMVISGEH